MTGEIALATIAAIGGLAGLVQLFQFLNTRGSTKDKSSTDSYTSYRSFISGATDDRDREITRMKAEREILWAVKALLIDIVQDLMVLAKNFGIPAARLDPFQDRLDAARRA